MKVCTFQRYKSIIREPMMLHKLKTRQTFNKRCDYEQNLVLEVDQNDDEVQEDLQGEENVGVRALKKILKVQKSLDKL